MQGRARDRGCRLGVVALVGALVPQAPGVALAEHDHAAMASAEHAASSELSIGLTLEAAEFDNMAYEGQYQGVTPQVGWARGRFGASAAIGLYHLEKNGLSTYGPGDAMLAGHATAVATDAVRAGVALHMMLPTGSERDAIGMGHVMAMPSAWATWHRDLVTVQASAGYSRALASLGGGGHDHGALPLVGPMNAQELTWSAGADLAVGRGLRVGGRASGGVAIGGGTTRVIGGGRIAWGTPRVSTGFELQLGVAGDPLTIRGVVETALRF